MNWRQGFGRLWLVVSVLYVAVVLYAIGLPAFAPLYKPTVFEVTFTSGAKHHFDVSHGRAALLYDVRQAYVSEPVARGASLDSEANSLTDNLLARSAQLRDSADTALMAVLAPPAVLAVLGMIAGWIAAGFRPGRA